MNSDFIFEDTSDEPVWEHDERFASSSSSSEHFSLYLHATYSIHAYSGSLAACKRLPTFVQVLSHDFHCLHANNSGLT